ncbi:OB-fold domain-containing protein [Polymorphospora lycopeni]|uniref:OB-fold domain-containing protein n=1 Tax=Polymorphospora lycopeni TaxID=3140240 RepID=A0ABV5CTY9_9ACTN
MNAGIVAYAAYLPRHRLTASDVAAARTGTPGGRGERRVAAFDEDALTMAVEAGRLVRRLGGTPATVVVSTTNPPYAGKNNASAAHAALALPDDVPAYDLGGSYRSVPGLLGTAAPGTLLLAADVTVGRPGGTDELDRGDAAAAVLLGPAEQAAVRVVERATVTEEFLDHWRAPGTPFANQWEERFAVERYLPLLDRVLARLTTASVDHVVISSPGPRTARTAAKRLAPYGPVRDLAGVGHAGAADPLVRLAATLDRAEPGQTILLLVLADGCDALVLRCTDRLPAARATPTVDRQLAAARPVRYLDYLAWRGLLDRAGPRRPDPAVASGPASARNSRWKFGLAASRCGSCDAVQAPPQRVCVRCGAVDGATPVPLSEAGASIRTFSVDRLAFSLNPPVVATVVDFDDGGRLEMELADPDPDRLRVGGRVRMVFRRRHASGGVHNYAWKASLEEETGD